MNFIALIIALAFQQYWGSARPVHRDGWFNALYDRLQNWGLGDVPRVLLSVVLPVALLVLLQQQLGGTAFGLPALLISILVLLYSFGRGDFEFVVSKYRDYCKAGDFEAAYLFAREQLGREGERCPAAAEELHRWMKERIAYQGFERWFAVIFWFALLGAPGALAYRLLHLCPEPSGSSDTRGFRERLLYLADWLPSRALVFAFAVTGDWVASRDQLSTALRDTIHDTSEVLSDAAHASLGLKTTVFADHGDVEAVAQVSDWEIHQLRDLLHRSAIAWVLVLALVVLLT